MTEIWASIHKFLRVGLLPYALILFSFSGLTGVAVTYAMSSGCILVLCTSNPTPTPTPNSTSVPSPTPISNPTPIPTGTPSPKATPSPQIQPNPSKVVSPVLTKTAKISAPVTGGSIFATTIAVTPMTRTDTTSANQQAQDTAGTSVNMLMLSLSVGLPLVLLAGGILWFLLFWRMSHNVSIPQGVGNRELQSNIGASQGISSVTFAPGVSRDARVLPVSDGTPPMSSPRSVEPSGNPQPIINTFPQHMSAMPPSNLANYPQNGPLRSPLMGSPNSFLPSARARARARNSNMNGQVSPLAASPTPLMDAPVQHVPSALPIQEVPPPSVEGNPVLGAAMRQAQGGLFTLPER